MLSASCVYKQNVGARVRVYVCARMCACVYVGVLVCLPSGAFGAPPWQQASIELETQMGLC